MARKSVFHQTKKYFQKAGNPKQILYALRIRGNVSRVYRYKLQSVAFWMDFDQIVTCLLGWGGAQENKKG
jgi:hypothetical protein